MHHSLIFKLLFLLLPCSAFAQLGIIKDKDGFCYVRSSPEKENNIRDTLTNGTMVFYFEPTGNWMEIDYLKGKQTRSGYVYKDRYTAVETLKEIKQSSLTQKSISFVHDSLRITIKSQPFDASKAALTYEGDNIRYLSRINGKPFWGTDGAVPDSKYQSIQVSIGAKTIVIPASGLYDLYQPNLGATKVNYDKETDTIYISAFNSDGAGGYFVAWKIEKGTYKERFVVHGF